MNTKKSLNRTVAVVFVMTLLISSGAQAGSLFSPDEGRTMNRSLIDQAATWILGTWTGFTSVFSFDSTAPDPSTQSCTPTADCGSDTDHGPGIDPEG